MQFATRVQHTLKDTERKIARTNYRTEQSVKCDKSKAIHFKWMNNYKSFKTMLSVMDFVYFSLVKSIEETLT